MTVLLLITTGLVAYVLRLAFQHGVRYLYMTVLLLICNCASWWFIYIWLFVTYNNRPGGLCNGASWRSNLGFLHELYYIKIKVVSAYGQNIYRRCVALRAGRDKCTHLRTAKGDFVTSPRAIYTIQSLACVSLSKFYNVLSRVEPGAAQSIFYSVHCVGLLCVHVTALTGHQYMWWLVTLLPQQESPETQQVSFAAVCVLQQFFTTHQQDSIKSFSQQCSIAV